MKNLVILGSTGSIGTQTLDVVARHPDRFRVIGLAAGKNLKTVFEQVRAFKPKYVSVSSEADAQELRKSFSGVEVLNPATGPSDMVQDADVDLVVSAIVGAAGLNPTMRAIEAGKVVALANKESLVIAGELMTGAARKQNKPLIPIDSEHSAIFQCLQGNRAQDVHRIVLTASGGPFFGKSREFLASVTLAQALKHPNWSMGPKITIDSATLMNKGLEMIEATWLFDKTPDDVAIHVHPQSIVHSFVEYIDGSVIAQMGVPDMRCAISYAMAYPERVVSGAGSLDLLKIGHLSFFPPDMENFPALKLAYAAAKEGRTMPAVLNAANEVAVARFLNSEIGFLEIPAIVEETMNRHECRPLASLQDVLEADAWARSEAGRVKIAA